MQGSVASIMRGAMQKSGNNLSKRAAGSTQ
jgi:hypothetical protein